MDIIYAKQNIKYFQRKELDKRIYLILWCCLYLDILLKWKRIYYHRNKNIKHSGLIKFFKEFMLAFSLINAVKKMYILQAVLKYKLHNSRKKNCKRINLTKTFQKLILTEVHSAVCTPFLLSHQINCIKLSSIEQ